MRKPSHLNKIDKLHRPGQSSSFPPLWAAWRDEIWKVSPLTLLPAANKIENSLALYAFRLFTLVKNKEKIIQCGGSCWAPTWVNKKWKKNNFSALRNINFLNIIVAAVGWMSHEIDKCFSQGWIDLTMSKVWCRKTRRWKGAAAHNKLSTKIKLSSHMAWWDEKLKQKFYIELPHPPLTLIWEKNMKNLGEDEHNEHNEKMREHQEWQNLTLSFCYHHFKMKEKNFMRFNSPKLLMPFNGAINFLFSLCVCLWSQAWYTLCALTYTRYLPSSLSFRERRSVTWNSWI